jgi:hypothetical protein
VLSSQSKKTSKQTTLDTCRGQTITADPRRSLCTPITRPSLPQHQLTAPTIRILTEALFVQANLLVLVILRRCSAARESRALTWFVPSRWTCSPPPLGGSTARGPSAETRGVISYPQASVSFGMKRCAVQTKKTSFSRPWYAHLTARTAAVVPYFQPPSLTVRCLPAADSVRKSSSRHTL